MDSLWNGSGTGYLVRIGNLRAQVGSRRPRRGPVTVTWRSIDVLAQNGTSRTAAAAAHKLKQAVQPYVSRAWTARARRGWTKSTKCRISDRVSEESRHILSLSLCRTVPLRCGVE